MRVFDCCLCKYKKSLLNTNKIKRTQTATRPYNSKKSNFQVKLEKEIIGIKIREKRLKKADRIVKKVFENLVQQKK